MSYADQNSLRKSKFHLELFDGAATFKVSQGHSKKVRKSKFHLELFDGATTFKVSQGH